MNGYELSRMLLFYGYTDMSDYLRNSPLNRHIYKKLLYVLPKHDLDVPIVELFNEVYYVCLRVGLDRNPGFDVAKRYFPPVEYILGNNLSASQLVFSLVWVMFQLKKPQTFNEECFMYQLSPYIERSDFYDDAKELLDSLQVNGISGPDSFHTMTCPAYEIPLRKKGDEKLGEKIKRVFSNVYEVEVFDEDDLSTEVDGWLYVTNGFLPETVEFLVRLYSKPEDQIRIIDCLCWASAHCTLKKHRKARFFLMELQDKIKMGKFPPAEKNTALQDDNCVSEKDGAHILVMGRDKYLQENPYEEVSTETAAEREQRLRDELNRQIELNQQFFNSLAAVGKAPVIVNQKIEIPNLKQFNNNPQQVLNQQLEDKKGEK